MRTACAIGIDVGGTKLAAGLVDGNGRLLAARRMPVPAGSYEAVLDAIARLTGELEHDAGERGETVSALGVAAAAFLDAERSWVRHAANLGWHDRPLRADLESRLQRPVTVANDADAAAWGEYVHGAAAHVRSLVFVTLGTGVGGGVILDGLLVTGAHGLGGELGHLQLEPGGLVCVCGARGCLEQYASGTALCRIARASAAARAGEATRLLALTDGRADAIEGEHVVIAAQQGDRVALDALEQVGAALGRGVAHVIAVLDPELVVVGGGLAAAGDLILDPARTACARHAGIPDLRAAPPLRQAKLGADAGIVGAAALARERNDPAPSARDERYGAAA